MTESTAIQRWSDTDLAYRAVMLKSLIGLAMDEFDAIKRIAGTQFEKGVPVGAFDGLTQLGTLGKDVRKPVPSIVNRAEFESWLRHKFDDQLETRLILGDPSEIGALLQDLGRDDLYTVEEFIPDELAKKALALAAGGGSVPGVELHTPESVVSAKPNAAAKAKVREVLAASPIPLLAIGEAK